jgi:ketosteroid isomerase-like protein
MLEEPTTPDMEEVFRRANAAVRRRDIDGGLAAYKTDAVWDASMTGVGVFEGREAIRGLFEDWLGAYEDFEQMIEEFRDLGDGMALVVLLQRARLKGSTAWVELHYAMVLIWSDGLILRVTTYIDIDEARAAAERLAKERAQADV